ncbi:MAG: hypothetical protein Q8L93_06730 [Rhodocyclaceae bacterium]|nr:hypothetical protein [Rhodocyclaceae bacterium]
MLTGLGARQFADEAAVSVETVGGQTLRIQKELSADGREVLLHGYSPGREAKETAMTARFTQGFEAGLQKIADGLQKPRAEKRYDKFHSKEERSDGHLFISVLAYQCVQIPQTQI